MSDNLGFKFDQFFPGPAVTYNKITTNLSHDCNDFFLIETNGGNK